MEASARVVAAVWLEGGGASCWIPVQDWTQDEATGCQHMCSSFIPTMLRLLSSPNLCRVGITVPVLRPGTRRLRLDHLSKDRGATHLTAECPAEARNQNRGILLLWRVAVVICRSNTVSGEKQVLKVT